MIRIVERLRHECSLSFGKSNVVVDALGSMTMDSASHVEEAKKELVNDFNRFSTLGVRLEDSPNGGFIVNHNSESYLVVRVKSKQHLDKPLMRVEEIDS